MNHCLLFSANDGVIDRSSGVHRIAHHLRKQGWDAEVIDFLDYWTLDELKELVKSRVTSNTKFFGYSYLFNRSNVTERLLAPFSKWIRENYPEIALISGGQATLLNLDHVDYHVVGYGEFALDALLKYLFSNGPAPTFNLTLSKGKTKVINALHSYPAYPMSDPMISYEARDFIMPGEWGRIEFSRGCKFSCLYCNYPVLGVKGDFTRSTDSVKRQMLDAYDRFGIEHYIVTDETFNDRTEKITKFADVMEGLPWDPYFAGYIRADLLISRPKDREELLRMGFLGHFYGIETFNPKTAKIIGKGMDPERVKQGLADIKRFFKDSVGNRYRAIIALIGGLPEETLESLYETKDWIKKNWLDQVTMASTLEINSLEDHRPSELSLDYSKYGYEEFFPTEEEKSKYQQTRPKQDFFFPKFSNEDADNIIMHGTIKSISWKNKNMNMYQASRWAQEIEDLKIIAGHNFQKMDPFFLSSILCEDDGTILDLDKKLSLIAKTSGTYYNNFYSFVENYKHKKMSLK